MEKRVSLGVQNKKKKKPTIKRNKKRKSLKKVVLDYLKSDAYMFAPLVSSTATHHLLASRIVTSSTTRLDMKDYMKGRKESCLLEKIVEYLKSDFFFYAPLFTHQHIAASPKDFGEYGKQDTMEVLKGRKLNNRKDDESTVKTSSVRADEARTHIINLPETRISGQKKLVHRESMKHMVFQSCRSSSVSGEGVLQSGLKKLLID